MSDRVVPKLVKWPFFLGDLLLCAVALWIVTQYPRPLEPWAMALVTVCVLVAAWLAVTPFLAEYRAIVRFAESDHLHSVVTQINDLQTVSEQIRVATSQWQGVQEHSGKTVTASREIADRIGAEAQAFAQFMEKANEAEKGHLRLEVEKLRRGESDWLQVVVRILDHVYALYKAGERSGRPELHEQLGRFQAACYDAARRMGLVPIEARRGESFLEAQHQLLDPEVKAPTGALVEETLATGYTYQGQALRRTVVAIKVPEAEPLSASQPSLLPVEGSPEV